jgi:16S rRNA (guanine966-N2)-methyltransferase
MRIIAGSRKGARIFAPKGLDTRPTADRVREAAFNLLGPGAAEDATVLDLFAGSGALGLEALSRGAADVTFVDDNRGAITAIKGNLATLKANAQVRQTDALKFLHAASTGGAQYDLVFLDPPYRLAERLAPPLSEALPAVLAPGAVAVAESDRRAPLALDLPLLDERRYGDTLIRIYGP